MILSHRIDGRLGNVMSEIFLTYHYAEKFGIPARDIVFNRDKTVFGREEDPGKRAAFGFSIGSSLDFFGNIAGNMISSGEFDATFGNVRYERFSVFKQEGFNPSSRDRLLLGEFCPIRYAVPDIFGDRPALDLYRRLFVNDDFVSRLKPVYSGCGKTLGVSVRRGDYLTYPGGRFLKFVKSADDYRSVIDPSGYDRIIVFSDDIEWCEENLRFENAVFHKNMRPCEDLVLLGMCDDVIVNANSTFCVHAAILNRLFGDGRRVLI